MNTQVRTAAEIEAELESLPTEIEAELRQTDDTITDPGEPQVNEDEKIARRKGWLPKEEYDGDPSKWVDAKTFNERGDRFNKNLQRKIEQLEKQIADFEGTKQAFKKFHEETVARKDAELEAAIRQLKVQRSQATMDGDHEAAVQLEEQIDLLNQERKAVKNIEVEQNAPENAPVQVNPVDAAVLDDWIEDGNDWFKDDEKLRNYAVNIGQQMVKEGTKLRGRKFLDEVARVVQEDFPRRFRNKNETPVPNRVEGNNGASARATRSGKTEADLPAEDLKLMREFIKNGWTTKEAFLKSYFSR